MLNIRLDSSQLQAASGAPTAGYYYAIALVPASNSDGIIIGNERIGSLGSAQGQSRANFSIYLPAAHDHKDVYSDAPPCLLPPQLNNAQLNSEWQLAQRELLKYVPPTSATYTDTVLRICVYEYLTNSMPDERKLKLKPDPWVQHAVSTHSPSTHGKLNQVQQIRSDLLTSHLVGSVYIGHAKLYKFWNGRDPITAVYQVYDTKAPGNVKIYRGNLRLHITPQLSIPYVGDSVEFWSRSFPKSKNSRYFKQARQCVQLNHDYILQYIKPFPPFQQPFRLTDQPLRDALHFKVESPQMVQLGGRTRSHLIPDKNDINNVHMPTVAIDGTWKIPVHFIFKTLTYAADDVFEWHEQYLSAICDNLCASMGTNTTALANSIHMYLDSNTAKPAPNPSVDFLAAMHIIGRLLTVLSTAITYRSDYVIAGDDNASFTVQACEDVSRDPVTNCTASCDCEDAAGAVYALNRLLLQGSCKHLPGSWYARDIVWQKVRQIQCGGWAHKGLDAIQRVLGYFACPLILGTVTGAYPGEQSITKAVTYFPNLDETLQQYRAGTLNAQARRELERYFCDSNINLESLSDVHRYCILIPLKRATDLLKAGTDAETMAGTVRYKSDQAALDRLQARANHIPNIALPTLMLEGTSPMSPFCIRSASSYLPPGEMHDKLRKIEAQSRHLSTLYRRDMHPKWAVTSAFMMDHGTMKFLSGNFERSLCSTFYNRLTQGDFAEFAELSDNNHLTTVTWIHQTARWGVPIQKVFGLHTQDVQLLPICHRIPYNLRAAYDEVAEPISRLLFPLRVAAYPPDDSTVILPPPPQQQMSMSDEVLTFNVFRWSVYYIKPDFATPTELQEYERQITKGFTTVHITEQKLVGLGAKVRQISVQNLNV